ncbi:YciI family protein [Mycolicibacterium sp. P9-22]|uniref:YciI family protein n=1 Tax=Mycolicibacterium sp. P9-22 TaxID=2024613 RepID=UPI0011EC4766|nr:YciI family protein [Mycolicibacterium sp. P9-22]KAA0114152.1 transcription initiation protein [Mycolicibacterium sp. P9-22]
MHYFALLLGPEPTGEPDAAAAAQIMAAYQDFHTAAGSAIRAGDALGPAADAVRITGGPAAPTVTDGPFAEGAEVAGGYYVFEADNLDDALEIARQIPACAQGGVEVWPMVGWEAPTRQVRNDWLALLLEPPEKVCAPTTEQWESGVCAHTAFGEAAGEHILAGAPLHPPSTATTVRVRDGKAIFTDGPYAEGSEVANGFYLLRAADRDEAVALASMIPASAVELHQLAGIAEL